MSLLLLLLSCTPTDIDPEAQGTDADGDGFVVADDCDDTNEKINPDAREKCNDTDDDCDGDVDEDLDESYFSDLDSDGYGDPETAVTACEQPDNTVTNSLDCDDTLITINPGAAEICDTIDNNCNGSVDEGLGGSYFADLDGDGHGDAAAPVEGCASGEGVSELSDDCNDMDPAVYPGAAETDCTSLTDFNCDGVATFFDGDVDGYTSCVDCDDANVDISPAAIEICDDVDNDCDDAIDEDGAEETTTWYFDSDGDGYGDIDTTLEACDQPSGYVSDGSDCDDLNRGINPGTPEVCDGIDDNCDGITDPSC